MSYHHLRLDVQEAEKDKQKVLALSRPPRSPSEKPWWDEDYTVAYKIRDRELFA